MSSQNRITSRIGRRLQAVIDPAVIDFWAAELGLIARTERVMARVVARWLETPDTVTLVLKPNRHFKGFQAGQHVNLTVEVAGVRHTRSYSFSEAPSSNGLVAITIKKVPGGRVSSHCVDALAVGDQVELGQAFGDMLLPAQPGPLLLLAAGSGVTPLMSLLRQQVQRGDALDTVLMFWVRTRQDLIFADELKQLAASHAGFRLVPVYEHESELQPGELSGRPCREQFEAAVPDLADRAVYVCGPSGFMKAVEALAASTARDFHAEAFSPPVFVPDNAAQTVTLTLKRSNRQLTVPAGMPLLDALEAQGIKPQSGCRMGICNTCACGKSEGPTRNLLTQEVSLDDTTSLRICVNAAIADLSLDL